MVTQLKARGYKEDDNFIFYLDKDAEHFEADWAKRVWRPLEYLFKPE